MSERTFGIEIECYGPSSRWVIWKALRAVGIKCRRPDSYDYGYEVWELSDDGTVNAPRGQRSYEIKSPILRGADGIRQVRKVCRVLADHGFKANRSCGLHVHLGARDLEPSEVYTMIKRYSEHEDEIDTFVGGSRRGARSRWAKSPKSARLAILKAYTDWKRSEARNSSPSSRRRPRVTRCSCGCGMVVDRGGYDYGGYTSNPFESLDSLFDASGSERYLKVNMQSYYDHGTLEFRQHHGTVDETEIVEWVKFLLNFARTSRELTTVRNGRGRTTREATKSRDTGALMGLRTPTRRHFQRQSRSRRLRAA